jgi:hypothetical protein
MYITDIVKTSSISYDQANDVPLQLLISGRAFSCKRFIYRSSLEPLP